MSIVERANTREREANAENFKHEERNHGTDADREIEAYKDRKLPNEHLTRLGHAR